MNHSKKLIFVYFSHIFFVEFDDDNEDKRVSVVGDELFVNTSSWINLTHLIERIFIRLQISIIIIRRAPISKPINKIDSFTWINIQVTIDVSVLHFDIAGNWQWYILFESIRWVPNGHWQLRSIFPIRIWSERRQIRRQRCDVNEQFDPSSVSIQSWPNFSIAIWFERHWHVFDIDEHSYNCGCIHVCWHGELIFCSNWILI